MTLLLDQNISHRLLAMLTGEFPQISHVREHGLSSADDSVIWNFASARGYTIVTKDRDFQQRSLLLGAPPKVIWLRVGNAGTDEIGKFQKGQSRPFSNSRPTRHCRCWYFRDATWTHR